MIFFQAKRKREETERAIQEKEKNEALKTIKNHFKFKTSRTRFESWVDASEFVPESSKPKLRPLTKTNSDVERNTEGNFLNLFF